MSLRNKLRSSVVVILLLVLLGFEGFGQVEAPSKGVFLAVKLETIGTTGMLLAKKRYGQLEFEIRPLSWKRSSFQISGGMFYIRDDQFFTLFQAKPSGFYGEDLGVVAGAAYRYLAFPFRNDHNYSQGGAYIMPQVFFHRLRHVENFSNPLTRDVYSDTTNSFAFGTSIGFQYPVKKKLIVDASFGLGYDIKARAYSPWIRERRLIFFPRLSIGYSIMPRSNIFDLRNE